MDDADINIPFVEPDVARERLKRACDSMLSNEGRARFGERFGDMVPNLLIVLLPIIALVGKLLYPLSRRYYVEHLLFYTHLHSFLFLLLIVMMFLSAAAQRVPALPIDMEVAAIGAGVYTVYYVYRALRRVFAQGRIATLIKMFLIWMAYVISASLLLAVGTVITALSV